MNNFLCYNCQGQGHRASQCQFAPTHRRCPTCGKAGGNHAHREGCSDSWYDLSVRVPRFKEDNRTTLTKQQVEAILFEGYLSERSDHELSVPVPDEENRAENGLSRDEHNENRDRESKNENADGCDERCAITGECAENQSENVRKQIRCAIAKNENDDCRDEERPIAQMDNSLSVVQAEKTIADIFHENKVASKNCCCVFLSPKNRKYSLTSLQPTIK